MRGRLLSGRYRLQAALGAGGMGEVWRARDEALGRDVAVKVFRPPTSEADDEADRTELLGRFRQEARAAAGLDSPYIVAVHDFGTDEDLPYLVMALVNGRSLEQVLRAEGRIPLARALEWAEQICGALTTAHNAGVIHRDIKPGNVMVTEDGDRERDGTVKVLDFGIAKFLDADAATSKLTRTGQMPMGTVLYMAPEQFTGAPSDGRLDLYALGCVLYELLIGRPPYTGNAAGVMYNHLHDKPLRPSLARAELPSSVDHLVLALMAREPDDRPTDAEAVAERLREISAGLAAGGANVPAVRPVPTHTDEPTTQAEKSPPEKAAEATPRDVPTRTTGPQDAPPAEPEDTPPVPGHARRLPVRQMPHVVHQSAERPSVVRDPDMPLSRARRRRRLLATAVTVVAMPLIAVATLSYTGSGSAADGGEAEQGPFVLATKTERDAERLRRVLKATGSPGPANLRVVTAPLTGGRAFSDDTWKSTLKKYPTIIGYFGKPPIVDDMPFTSVEGREGYSLPRAHSTVAGYPELYERLLTHLRETYGMTSILHLGDKPKGGGSLASSLKSVVDTDYLEHSDVRFHGIGPSDSTGEVDRAAVRSLLKRHKPEVAVLPEQAAAHEDEDEGGYEYGVKELRADGFKGVVLTDNGPDREFPHSTGAGSDAEVPDGVFRVREFADRKVLEDCELKRELCVLAKDLTEPNMALEEFDAMLAVAYALRKVKADMSLDDARVAFDNGTFHDEKGLVGPAGRTRADIPTGRGMDSFPGSFRGSFWLDRSEGGLWKEHTQL